MNLYELVFILSANLSETDQDGAVKSVKQLVEKFGGAVKDDEIWEKRDLAYDIKKESQGIYVVMHLEMEGEKTNEFETNMRQNEQILRHLLLQQEVGETKEKD
ncbi:30S ribosomal protein S6 [Patescibacteria group bacterium]